MAATVRKILKQWWHFMAKGLQQMLGPRWKGKQHASLRTPTAHNSLTEVNGTEGDSIQEKMNCNFLRSSISPVSWSRERLFCGIIEWVKVKMPFGARDRVTVCIWSFCGTQITGSFLQLGLLTAIVLNERSFKICLLELLGNLYHICEIFQIRKETRSPKTQLSSSDNSSESAKSTEELLRSRLQIAKVLIMLDDVWDFKFLRDFFKLSGPYTKFIVTSRENICENKGLDSLSPVCMETVEPEVAEQIFAVHAGLPKRCIPPSRKGVAQRLFQKADYHPLAIAQLGAQLGQTADKKAAKIWQDLEKHIFQYLGENPLKEVAGSVYPLSYWVLTEKSYEYLSPAAQHLFVLLGMSKGPSVSDDVLGFLLQHAFPTLKVTIIYLGKWKAELQSSQLLSKSTDSSMSIHDLHKDFVFRGLKAQVDDITERSRNSAREPEQFTLQEVCRKIGYITTALAGCCLGVDVDLQHREAFESKSLRTKVILLVICLNLDPEINLTRWFLLQSGYSFDTFIELKRKTVEPIIEKLVEECTPQSSDFWSSATEVLLEFICHDRLLQGSILRLLSCENWIEPTAGFLGNLGDLDPWFWTAENKSIQSIACRLIELLQEHTSSEVLDQVDESLCALCSCLEPNSHSILCTPDILEKLIELLRQTQNPSLQCVAAKAVSNLVGGSFGHREEICNHSTLLDILVRSLAADRNSNLRRLAALALRNLVGNVTDPSRHVRYRDTIPYILRRLGDCLKEENHPDLQRDVASALSRLAVGGIACYEILTVPKLLETVVQCLRADQNVSLQKNAAATLNNIAESIDTDILNDLAHCPDLLENLVELLSRENMPELQVRAVGALSNLAASRNSATLDRLAHFPNLMERLGELLTKQGSPMLQRLTANALRHLTANAFLLRPTAVCSDLGRDARIQKVMSVPKILGTLVQSLDADKNPGLQDRAAASLENLAKAEDSAILDSLANISQLLERLCECIGRGNPNRPLLRHFEGTCAVAFHTLICKGSVETLDKSGMVQTLLERLSNVLEGKDLQEHGAAVIAYLANKGDGTLKTKMLGAPRLVGGLICCISQDHNQNLQVKAASALCNLAATKDILILNKMVSFPGLLDRLGCAVDKPNRRLQMEAGWALAHLAGAEDLGSWYKIVKFPSLLDTLVQLMARAVTVNEGYDEDEAKALGNLARIGDEEGKNRMAHSKQITNWLVESLQVSQNSELQENAAWALGNIASAEDETIKQKITNLPGLRHKLVQALDEDGAEAFKVQVTRVLSYFSLQEN